MYKPASLREHLKAANPDLKRNPDKLHIFVDDGTVIGSATKSLSFQYSYRLNIIIEDYAGSADAIMVPLLAWAKVHQPDLFTGDEKRNGLSFDVDIINHETIDISIKLSLTERVIVKDAAGGRLDIEHQQEPQRTPNFSDDFWTLYDGDTKLAEWHTP